MEPLSPQNCDSRPLSHPEAPDSTQLDKQPNRMNPHERLHTSLQANAKSQSPDQNHAMRVHIPPKRTALRIASALVALVPLTLLITAGTLNPAEKGLGTHQQLGLPPCSLRVLAGIRCPACGMTTSWCYFARGNWLASMKTNAGGFSLALLCLLTLVPAAEVVRCGHLPSTRVQTWLTMAGAGVLVVTLVDWIIRLQY